MTATLPINHLKRTLDRCCGQWEFVQELGTCAWYDVLFLNTHERYRISFDHETKVWSAYEVVSEASPWSKPCAFLSARLNGHTRDDAGNVSGDGDRSVEGEWQIIINPPPNLIIEAGDEFMTLMGEWLPFAASVGKPLSSTCVSRAKESGFQIRRRIQDPMFIEPDKVVL